MKILPNILRTLCACAVVISPVFAADEKPKDEAVATVAGKSLIAFLPETREGWKNEAPTSEEREISGVKATCVKGAYIKPGENFDSKVSIAIADMVRGKEKLAAMLAQWKEDTDPETYVPSRDGSTEQLATASGFPAYVETSPKQAYQEFNVIVADRFLVTMQAFETRPEDAVAWLKAVNLKKLAELK
jgi:hypothetical protein